MKKLLSLLLVMIMLVGALGTIPANGSSSFAPGIVLLGLDIPGEMTSAELSQNPIFDGLDIIGVSTLMVINNPGPPDFVTRIVAVYLVCQEPQSVLNAVEILSTRPGVVIAHPNYIEYINPPLQPFSWRLRPHTDELPFNEFEERHNITYFRGGLIDRDNPPPGNATYYYPFEQFGLSYVRVSSIQELENKFPYWTENFPEYEDSFFEDNFLIFVRNLTEDGGRFRVMSIICENNVIEIETAHGSASRDYFIYIGITLVDWISVIEMDRSLIDYDISLTSNPNFVRFNPAIGDISYYVTASAETEQEFPTLVTISSVEELSAYYAENSTYISARMRNDIFLNPKFNEGFFNLRSLIFIVGEEESAFNRLEITDIAPCSSVVDWRIINFNLTRTIPPPNFELPTDDTPRFWHFVVDVAYWVLEPHRELRINIEDIYHVGTPTPIEPELPYIPAIYDITATPTLLNFGVMQQGGTLPPAQTITITNSGNVDLTLNPLPNVAGFILENLGNTNLASGQSREITVHPNTGLAVGNHNTTFTISTVEGVSVDVELRFTVEQAQTQQPPIGSWSRPIAFPPSTTDPTTPNELPFVDVNSNDWFYNYVRYVFTNNLMNGISPTEFAPNSPTTRAMFVTVLWRLANSPTANGASQFVDVASGTWYNQAIAWAAENGIVLGVSETEFAPHLEITREQIAAMIYRGLHIFAPNSFATQMYFIFEDADEISPFANNAIQTLANMGIMQGNADGTFNPQGLATRAEVAAVIQRLSER